MAGVADAYLNQTLAGRYRLVSHLADGGFSHVFKSVDQRSEALVAVKVLKPDAAVHPESAVEFDHEGELLEALGKSRNVVGLLDSDSSTIAVTLDGTPLPLPVSFHVMELADAALSELLPVRHEVDWGDKLRLFRDVVAGIHQIRAERNTPAWGLLWAIRRVDIIIKNLEHNRAVKAAASRRRH